MLVGQAVSNGRYGKLEALAALPVARRRVSRGGFSMPEFNV
jgi:hypothetical protein